MALGYTEYEAKAYVALVKIQPATAYEISKESGIPSSKIYEIINRLAEKKIVLLVIAQDKKKYVPMPPEEFIESRKSFFDKTLTDLKESLPELAREEGVSFIWNIYEYEYLLDKARRMIQKADAEILISAWRDELVHLGSALKASEAGGVKIALVHFGKPDTAIGQLFQHPIEDTLYDEKGGRGFTVVCDGKTALTGTVTKELQVEGAWSHNLGFVTLAEDYVKHDIYIMKIIKRFDPGLKSRFGNNYMHLRDIYNDKEA